MGTPESGAETHAPLLQSDLVRVGQDDLALLGPQDDALLAPHLESVPLFEVVQPPLTVSGV